MQCLCVCSRVLNMKPQNIIIFTLGLLANLPASMATASPNCDLCVTVVDAIEEFVLAGETMDDIVNKMEQFCTTLGALQPLCESFIEKFLPGIVEDILHNQLEPCAICRGLGICLEDGCIDTTLPPTTSPSNLFFKDTPSLSLSLTVTRSLALCGDCAVWGPSADSGA